MALLELPEPFDFELTTERFRAFGNDLANLWVDGALHRVVGTRELRIEAAPGGAEVEPLDDETRPVALALLGAPFELDAFYAWAQDDPVLRELTVAAGRLPAAARAGPVRVARHLDHRPAGLALRGVRDPQPADRALRPAGRPGLRVPDGRAAARGEPRRADRARLLQPQGRVRARPRAGAGRPARARLAAGRGGEAAARLDPRDRRVDGRVVPRTASRAPARVAGRRRRAREGGGGVLSGRGRPAARPGRASSRSRTSSAHYLLTGASGLATLTIRLRHERARSDRRRRADAARLHRGDLRRELGPAVAPAGGHAEDVRGQARAAGRGRRRARSGTPSASSSGAGTRT